MNTDISQWRCTCGESSNSAKSLICKTCHKQRWSLLGFTPDQARNLLLSIFPSFKSGDVEIGVL